MVQGSGMMLDKIPTKGASGQPNGWLLPIWHVDTNPQIDQVYLTVVNKGAVKGPHLHFKRRGVFICIRGDVKIVIGDAPKPAAYEVLTSGESEGFRMIHVAPGRPAAIYNIGSGDAYVLNMPSPPWRADDQDEHPVEDWSYKP